MSDGDLPMSSYAAAGVDIEAGEKAVELMKASVRRTDRPGVLGGLGGFAGLFQLDLARYPQPVLASSTDGVGTKIALARALDKHDTIGIDLVAMVVDDLVVAGAEPLFLSDYVATGKVVPERIAEIVAGIAEGCVRAGCALVGGETAEHPGLMEPDEYDLSATGVGVVNADAVLGAERVAAGDALIAMASSGLHSNGYSLVRHVIERAALDLHARPAELGGATLGAVLLEPTRVYALDCLALAAEAGAHAFAHVTGGGLAANLARVIPDGLTAVVDRGTWTPPAVFALLAAAGAIPADECERAFNMGVGMVAIVPADRATDALSLLARRGVPAWRLGDVGPASDQSHVDLTSGDAAGAVRMAGSHPSEA